MLGPQGIKLSMGFEPLLFLLFGLCQGALRHFPRHRLLVRGRFGAGGVFPFLVLNK